LSFPRDAGADARQASIHAHLAKANPLKGGDAKLPV
jgi:hypothetical protein